MPTNRPGLRGLQLTYSAQSYDYQELFHNQVAEMVKAKEAKAKREEEKRMNEIEELAKKGIVRTYLYDGQVKLDFKQNSSKYRYVITDTATGMKEQSVRGVTSVLGDVLDKPGLRTWPMNMSHAFLFGSTWVTINEEDGAGMWAYDPKKAALKPGSMVTAEQYQSLMDEASKQWTKRSDRGKDIGHMVHSACELYVKKESKDPVQDVIAANGEVSEEDQKAVALAFRSFADWWTSLPNVNLIGVERPVYSRQLNYCGTFDLAVEIAGKSYLLDIKTTNRGREAPLGIYPEMFLQLGAYSYAYREETGHQFDDVGIVNVGKDGRLTLATAADYNVETDECERAFAFGARLHDWTTKIRPLTKERSFSSVLYYGSKDKKVGTELAK